MITALIAAELLRVASLYSGLPAPAALPEIHEVSKAELCRLVSNPPGCDLDGLAQGRTVWINRELRDRSLEIVLVHEMVHYLQAANGIFAFGCEDHQRLEDQAVGVQDRYAGRATIPTPQASSSLGCSIIYSSERGRSALARAPAPYAPQPQGPSATYTTAPVYVAPVYVAPVYVAPVYVAPVDVRTMLKEAYRSTCEHVADPAEPPWLEDVWASLKQMAVQQGLCDN
jgi:hypothetical protein